jgi:outer membrane protein
LSQPKLAYVRSHDLISRFKGTIDAKEEFEIKRRQMLSNVDSLELQYNHSREIYFQLKPKPNHLQQVEYEKELRTQEQRLKQYRSVIEDKIEEEDGKMMEAVLGQINSHIEEYAKANGHDLILGTTLSGNLLYGKENLDITEELLRELNLKYSGK